MSKQSKGGDSIKYDISSTNAYVPDRFLGYLLALPFSWPSPPFYWCSFLVALIVIISSDYKTVNTYNRNLNKKFILVSFLIIVSLFSNLINLDGPYEIVPVRVFTTSLIFILFLLGSLIKNNIEVVRGYTQMMFIWALLVIFMAFHDGIYKFGALLFSVPEYRLWGGAYFPDWPNYFAFYLSLAFLLSTFLLKQPIMSIFLLFAAILTTSRTSLFACSLLVFFVICISCFRGSYFRRFICLICIVLIMLALLALIPSEGLLMERMLVISDRLEIIGFALELAKNSIFLGHGAILLDDSVGFYGFASFHNTYLDILVRYGIFALISFIFLILPNSKDVKVGGVSFFLVFLFFALGSLFQNFLKHPHIIILFSVIMNSSRAFKK